MNRISSSRQVSTIVALETSFMALRSGLCEAECTDLAANENLKEFSSTGLVDEVPVAVALEPVLAWMNLDMQF